MDEHEWLTERFQQHRPHLRAVAYRMLGSVTEADDAVQEAWLRIREHDPASVENMQAWLTTIVGRVCLNMLRSRRSRREELSVHVPDPVVSFDEDDDPEHEVLLAESVGLALLVVLDALTPAERLAFVLHDVFGVPFADIATALNRSETAAQQLASRARRRVRGAPEPDPDLARQREIVDAFFAASRDGDFDALMAVLDPDVELRIDAGVLREEASLALHGDEAVAGHAATYSKLHPFVIPALVNGAAGAVVAPHGRLFSVMAFTVTDGKIIRIDALLDPDRLARLELAQTTASCSRSPGLRPPGRSSRSCSDRSGDDFEGKDGSRLMNPEREAHVSVHDRLKVVRDCYSAFASGDRSVLEQHLSDDFVFSAPPDVGIDRATFFERCWPNAHTIEAFEYERLFEAGGEVFVTYESTRTDGRRFRNTEIFGFDGEKISRQEVYFGWDVE